MLGPRRRRRSLHTRPASQRDRDQVFELILWGIPLAMIAVASVLILSLIHI